MSHYAPEYTHKQKITYIAKQMLWCIPLYLATQFWFFDWLSEYSANAHCYTYGSITGVHLIMYGLFAGIPLSLAVIVAALEGSRALRILKAGQNPLPGEMVFRKTKYKYGPKALIQPIALSMSIICLFIFSVWGSFQAYDITQDIKPCELQLEKLPNTDENNEPTL